MKDIDKLLENAPAPKPQRVLREDFTQRIVQHINDTPPKQPWNKRFAAFFSLKTLQKPTAVIAIVISFIALSGSAYALANWPAITALFGGEQRLASGNHIVTINTENCAYTGQQDRYTVHYEIKQSSPLTNEEVVNMALGACEQSAMYKIINPRYEESRRPNHSVSTVSFVEVVALTDTTITVTPGLYPGSEQNNKNTTYKIDPTVKVYDYNKPIHLENIKVGDSVSLWRIDSRNISTEVPDYVEDISTMAITGIIKLKPLTGDPVRFYRLLGRDFVRTEQNKDGSFTRAYDFHD